MNRVAVITGASSGLGLALAEKFIQEGHTVWGVSRTKQHWKDAYCRVKNSKHFFLSQADLTKEAQVKHLLKKLSKKVKNIDVVINNAGYGGKLERVEQISLSEFKRHLSHNLISAFLMAKHVIPIFRRQKKGCFIHISSMAGKRAVPKVAAYSAAKFGLVALSQSIAKENMDIPLKSIAVCPGGMNTKMREQLFGADDSKKQQSVEFVADVIMRVLRNEINVDSGGDILIRHGKITAVNPAPSA